MSDSIDFTDVSLDLPNQNLVGSNGFCLVFSEIVEKTTSLVSSCFSKIRNLVESLSSSWVLSSKVELLEVLDDVMGEVGERISSVFKGLIGLTSKVLNGENVEKEKFLNAILNGENLFWSSFKIDNQEAFENGFREGFSKVSYASIERFKKNGGTVQDVVDYINGCNTFSFDNIEFVLLDVIKFKCEVVLDEFGN